MTAKVKPVASCPRKKNYKSDRRFGNKNKTVNLYVQSSTKKVLDSDQVVLVQSIKTARAVYCHMYDQEERDIENAIRALAKYAQ